MMLYENTRTVYNLVHNAAAEHGDRVFLQYEENGIIFRVTYKEFADECDAIAAWAREKRAQVGHKLKVGILGVSSHHYLAVLLGVMSGGDTGIPLDVQLNAQKLADCLNRSDVDVLFYDWDFHLLTEEVKEECPEVVEYISLQHGKHVNCSDKILKAYEGQHVESDAKADECAMILFTSGTTGNPKMAAHSHTYALGHFVTAKYWHCCERDGLHLTISDTGWGKSLWGKLYGQWLCEGAVFVYDFDRFDASDILPMFKKYNITTFCAPPTMLRMMIKEDLARYDLSSIHHMTTAGEALNPEVSRKFSELTGLTIMEGFGQTETTLTVCNLAGTVPKLGSMGMASPQYQVDLLDPDGNPVANGEVGEICIKTSDQVPCGLFLGYYKDDEKTKECWYDGYYHTRDTAWRDEDGYFWYVSRTDDVIKSSGYRIGPFEIESVIMELPYVLECGVSAAPDPVRGQIVKASIVLTKGTEPSEELKKEIQAYVKAHTAPYKYPRMIVFRESLPKTISGKIQRNKL